jgi:translation initiation factor 2 subunit 1
MRKAEAAGTEECPVKIKLVAPPLYVLTTQTLDKVNQLSRAIFTLFGNVSRVVSGN